MFSVTWNKEIENISGSDNIQVNTLALFLYSFRWNIEVGYYEQKTFWSLCKYMIRKSAGIETFVNLINLSYSTIKILPYIDPKYLKYKDLSVRDLKNLISEEIRKELFFGIFAKKGENVIKSLSISNFMKNLILQEWNKRFFL